MLAISRALLTNPRLLVMDEPTEGLAPVIVTQVEEMLVRLGEEGDIVGARDRAEHRRRDRGRRTASPSWSTAASTASSSRARLAADRDLQQRLLGVGRHADEARRSGGQGQRRRHAARRRARRARRQFAIYLSNPMPPTRWSQPVPIARIEPARGRSRPASLRLRTAARPRRDLAAGATSGRRPCSSPARSTPRGRNCASSATSSQASGLAGAPRRPLDLPASRRPATSRRIRSRSITRAAAAAVFGPDRGDSVAGMTQAFANWLRRQGDIVGVIIAPAAPAAPPCRAGHAGAADRRAEGIISTVASGDVGPMSAPATSR